MIVEFEGKRWELDMPFQLFESLKLSGSMREVEIVEINDSTYKRVKMVRLSQLEDYSIARNKRALMPFVRNLPCPIPKRK